MSGRLTDWGGHDSRLPMSPLCVQYCMHPCESQIVINTVTRRVSFEWWCPCSRLGTRLMCLDNYFMLCGYSRLASGRWTKHASVAQYRVKWESWKVFPLFSGSLLMLGRGETLLQALEGPYSPWWCFVIGKGIEWEGTYHSSYYEYNKKRKKYPRHKARCKILQTNNIHNHVY